MVLKAETEGVGGAAMPQGQGEQLGAGALRRRGRREPAAGCPTLGIGPTDLQGSREQTASAGSLFNASECVAAERPQFVGKQTPGWGRNRLAPSRPGRHAARTPPLGALGLALRDRRYCAPPLPRPPSPGFRFRLWPHLVATPQLLLAPEAAGGIRSLGFCPCDVPPVPWRPVRPKPCTNWDKKSGSGRLVQFAGSSEGVGNAAFPVCVQDLPLNISARYPGGQVSTCKHL